MSLIFLDECGFTGADLTNQDQPFLVLATLCLEEEECQELKQRFFARVQARELKHSSLSKYPSQRRMIICFLQYLGEHKKLVKISLTHKRFALVCKYVDLLIETAMHEVGIDIYQRGENIALSNLLFYGLPAAGGDDFFSTFLESFQTMVRLPTTETYSDFFGLVFARHKSDLLDELLVPFKFAHYQLGVRLLNYLPANSLDIAFAAALNLMALWRTEIDGSITLIHDQSSNMSGQKQIWDALMDANLRRATLGYDRRRMTFPIALEQTMLERSERWAGLQLADIVAGAVARGSRSLTTSQEVDDLYGTEVFEVIKEFTTVPILPEPVVTPEELGTVGEDAENPVEYFVDVIRKVE